MLQIFLEFLFFMLLNPLFTQMASDDFPTRHKASKLLQDTGYFGSFATGFYIKYVNADTEVYLRCLQFQIFYKSALFDRPYPPIITLCPDYEYGTYYEYPEQATHFPLLTGEANKKLVHYYIQKWDEEWYRYYTDGYLPDETSQRICTALMVEDMVADYYPPQVIKSLLMQMDKQYEEWTTEKKFGK